ncbi:MAG: sugar phosphate isomerase/epimerase [Rhodopirellula sp.]|nr:sugar phosphate isomerase/epimerase [Rhodopirellula sp.]
MFDPQLPRRNFLLTAGGGLASACLSDSRSAAADSPAKNSICVFTKPFNSLTFDELADRIAELGFDGVEAPIRNGGHIEPEAVPEELPKLVEALRTRNLELTVMTSSINDPNDPLTETILKTASALGVRRYRMQYFKYDFGKPILKQLDEWRPRFKDLAAMNKEFGITAVYQNHAGRNYLGAPLWDLRRILEGIAVNEIGVAYDIRHATVEGGMSWPVTYHMIRPHIDTVYVKDFVWDGGKPKNVPLGEGQISADFFQMLKKSGFEGPISLHEEYLDHRKPELVPTHLAAIKQDFATLEQLLS